MIASPGNIQSNTSHKVVLPFYAYAAVAFLVATVLLLLHPGAVSTHYFQPITLAVVHTMALGWGTMIILGASHQLVPVLIESALYSTKLAHLSFWFAAVGIPMLVYGFYFFQLGTVALIGAGCINIAVIIYATNLMLSHHRSKQENIHALFVLVATIWLLLTTLTGFVLLINFTYVFLPENSLHYLSLHAHLGIIGWFLLLVIGVGSRLIPMFLISKYTNNKLLWIILWLVNAGLLFFVLAFLYHAPAIAHLVPLTAILAAIICFANFCYRAYQQRIRKKVDEQMKLSLLSVFMMVIPLLFLAAIILLIVFTGAEMRLVLTYGFTIFFGWITAIIFGMTFKTLPFIIWNKIYSPKAGLGATPNPKDLFNTRVYTAMCIAYLVGFVVFVAAILLGMESILLVAALAMFAAAVLYNWNVMKMLFKKVE